jgi:hypothetical protein
MLNRKLDIQMGDLYVQNSEANILFSPAYTRKVDLRVANALSASGATVQKITGDIRHLASQKEMEE